MDKQANYAVGVSIRRIRKKRGLTQNELAYKVGMSRTAIVNMERGYQSVTIENLYAISDALKCSVHELIPENKKPLIRLVRKAKTIKRVSLP